MTTAVLTRGFAHAHTVGRRIPSIALATDSSSSNTVLLSVSRLRSPCRPSCPLPAPSSPPLTPLSTTHPPPHTPTTAAPTPGPNAPSTTAADPRALETKERRVRLWQSRVGARSAAPAAVHRTARRCGRARNLSLTPPTVRTPALCRLRTSRPSPRRPPRPPSTIAQRPIGSESRRQMRPRRTSRTHRRAMRRESTIWRAVQ
mmetsp:Transcript_11318/g.27377  ORF Transcript_11318/g.27377 Transcript_11318/m.27377 type:complete len:202 (+) Transcript_11318:421-1026(+)